MARPTLPAFLAEDTRGFAAFRKELEAAKAAWPKIKAELEEARRKAEQKK